MIGLILTETPSWVGTTVNATVWTYILLPLLIAVARVIDVSLGTLRIIFVSKGYKHLAPIVGFIEILIWLFAIGQLIQNLTNVVNYFAFASGFAVGNYLGIYIEGKLSMGIVLVRIITNTDAKELVKNLNTAGFGATNINAEGEYGSVRVIFTVVKRKLVPEVVAIIKTFSPQAFYTLEDIRFVSATQTINGNGKPKDSLLKRTVARAIRKGK